jgi:glycosyltransferase involved in cell wall biosynthesis
VVVGVLSCSYPRFRGDPAGIFVADDVRRLVQRGFEVELLAAGDGRAGVSRTREGGVTVTRISSGLSRDRSLFYGDGAPEVLERHAASGWIEAAYFTAALCREVRSAAHRWDSVVSHWLVPCGLAAMAATRGGLQHRSYAHSGDVALLERLPWGRTVARAIADAGAEVVFVSRDLQGRFAALLDTVEAFGRVDRLVPDADLFHDRTTEDRAAARRRLGLSRPTVVAVGRLVPIKGFDVLLDAVGDLAEVVLIGTGSEGESLRRQARRLGVSLRLPGVVPRAELPAWLAAADVYVQPSRVLPSGRTEGLPTATLEALAVGLPVVAARCGGLAELDEPEGRVRFFEPGDAASLRGALLTILGKAGAR